MGQIVFSVTHGCSAKHLRRKLLDVLNFIQIERHMLCGDCNKLKPVSPGIVGIKIDECREGCHPLTVSTPLSFQRVAQFPVNPEYGECRVSFPLPGEKSPFHANVQLLRAALKPATSALAQRRGFLNFFQAQKRAV